MVIGGFERPKTAQEAVLSEIRQRLLDGRLRPSSAIRPDALGSELGVSAVPVREALRILEGEGQVSYRPHRGYLVAELDIGDLREIYRIRDLLEAEAVRGAVGELQPEDIERMRDAMLEMESVESDIVGLTAANRRFHFTLLEAAQMPHLNRLIRGLWDSSDPYRSHYFMRPQNRKRVYEEHRRILDAVEAGDADRIIEELAVHRQNAVAEFETGLMPISEPPKTT